MTWRTEARPLIAAALAEATGTVEERAEAARAAFPWGPRRHHPYRIWCDEVRRQLGLPSTVTEAGRRRRKRLAERAGDPASDDDPRQPSLFGE